MKYNKMPTADQCNDKTVLFRDNDHLVYADWFPQMGGSYGMALVQIDLLGEHSCFEVLVWHDGEFPIKNGENPLSLHYCEAADLIEFGSTVIEAQKKASAKTPTPNTPQQTE